MKFIQRLVLIFITISLLFVVTELALKLYLKNIDNQLAWTTSPNYKLDSDLIYSRLPNGTWTWKSDEFEEKVISNNIGFRDKNIGTKNNVFRIIAVGDSFTFGHGIENNDETYPKQLESYLNKNSNFNKRIEVINAAEKGYSPDQEYRQIRKRLLQLDPDMIIWNISVPGDLYNLIHTPGWPVPSLYDVHNNQLVELNAKFNWLYISNFLRYRFSFLNQSYIFNLLVRLAANVGIFSRKPLLSDNQMLDWAWKKMVLEIEDIQELAKQKNFELFIVFLPYPWTFYPQYQKSEIALVMNSFKDELINKGVSVIDVKEGINDDLEATKAGETASRDILGIQNVSFSNLYYKTDYHPNKMGARVFANIVGEIIKLGLEPKISNTIGISR